MATAGGASNARRRGSRRKGKKARPENNKAHEIPDHQNHLSTAIPALISAASAAHSFLLRHDLHLSPSQSLSLESLLSSTSRSLSHLLSLLSLPIPPTPPPPPPPPPPIGLNWFDCFLSSSTDNDPRWVQFFNLSKPYFTLLLRLLTPSLTSSLHPLPPNAALAATLFRLTHAASFSSVGRRFSLDSATACRAFYSVCKAIVENLGHLFEFQSDINRIILGFGWISLPNCCGVLGIDKFDLEGGNASLLVQALVDSEGRFLDVSAGWPGSKKPEHVLKRSKLYSGIEDSKEYLNGPAFELSSGSSIPQYILGGSCYPLLPWLLTPFNKESTASEVAFNGVHRAGVDLVGMAFANVRKRWKLVGKKWNERCVEAFPFVIVACCLLHNFLIKCSEILPEEKSDGCRDVEFPVFDGEDDESGKRVREALALHLGQVSQSS